MIPTHTADGFLPAGEHAATWDELVAAFGGSPTRALLLRGLRGVLVLLADAGCTMVYIGGSFVTRKPQPGDVDAAWDDANVDMDVIHPMFLSPDGIRAVFAMFGVHLYPANAVEGASGITFREFFQTNKLDEPVGVIALDLETL